MGVTWAAVRRLGGGLVCDLHLKEKLLWCLPVVFLFSGMVKIAIGGYAKPCCGSVIKDNY